MPQQYDDLPFELDHVIAVKHGGPTLAENLALSCFYDNNRKGPNLAGIDPLTGRIVPLFHPRRRRWSRHFRWDGPILVGRTQVGRATVVVLEMNLPVRVELRELLIEAWLFPPF